jgi:hypothetical protein
LLTFFIHGGNKGVVVSSLQACNLVCGTSATGLLNHPVEDNLLLFGAIHHDGTSRDGNGATEKALGVALIPQKMRYY